MHQSPRALTHEWGTPPHIIEACGGPRSFDLDPCAMVRPPVKTARKTYTILDNGLLKPWSGRVWLNPPYSTAEIKKWLARMAEHDHGIALIMARTETDHFFRYVWERATALLFMRSPRLHFIQPDGSPAEHNCGAPTVLCAYGRDDADVLAFCGIEGQFVPLKLPRAIAALAIIPTWSEALRTWLLSRSGPVALADIYRAFASHPKTKTNPHWREQIRKVLQQGPFERVERGVWQAA